MRYRLYPTAAQGTEMGAHCRHARFVWNLALEQFNCWQRGLGPSPRYVEQNRQLTEARRESEWLSAGSAVVQQQALHDFDVARQRFFAGTGGRPTWRRRYRHEGFRVTGSIKVRRAGAHWGELWIPKVGWIRFRWSRPAPVARSFRVTFDQSGRWHVAFAVWPAPTVTGPENGSVVGVDRGVTIPFACSDGRSFSVPGLSVGEQRRLRLLQQRMSRRERDSHRRERARLGIARLKAREVDRRRDAIEKATTELARTADLLRIEDLRVQHMTRSAKGTIDRPGTNVRAKAGLNRSILSNGWSLFARRLTDKAAGRVELVDPAFTSQRCSRCRHVASESRESQARFRCVACGFTDNADFNAARNIAAGHAVTGQGGSAASGLSNCQLPTVCAVGSLGQRGEVDAKLCAHGEPVHA